MVALSHTFSHSLTARQPEFRCRKHKLQHKTHDRQSAQLRQRTLYEMSRQQRQANRLRGAGRTTVDAAPIHFTFKDLQQPLNDDRRSRATNNKTSEAQSPGCLRIAAKKARVMDFATPKTVSKKARLRTPARLTSPLKVVESETQQVHSPFSVAAEIFPDVAETSTPQRNICADAFERVAAELNLTPQIKVSLEGQSHETPAAWPNARPVPMTPQVAETPCVNVLSTPAIGYVKHLDRSIIKAQHDIHREIVEMSNFKSEVKPKVKAAAPIVKRKLTKLERELGLGSSRFIMGAPNYITPERSDGDDANRRSQRLSRPLAELDQNTKAMVCDDYRLVATPGKSRTIKMIKRVVNYRPLSRSKGKQGVADNRVVKSTPEDRKPISGVKASKPRAKPKFKLDAVAKEGRKRATVACPECRRAKKKCLHSQQSVPESAPVPFEESSRAEDTLDLLSG